MGDVPGAIQWVVLLVLVVLLAAALVATFEKLKPKAHRPYTGGKRKTGTAQRTKRTNHNAPKMDRLNRLHIQDPWYTEILAGRKDVEGRTGPADKFAGWAGKPVLVTNGKHSAVLVVAAVRHYPDLASYLEGEGWGRVAPHTGSTQGAADAYHDITMKGGVQVFGDARVAARGGMCAVELGGLRRRFTNENGVEVTTEVGPAEQKEGGPPGVRIAIGCSKSESEWVVTPGEAAALQRQLAAFLVK